MDYMLLMHRLPDETPPPDWKPYLDWLAAEGRLRGGSAIGSGAAFRKFGTAPSITAHVSGFIRIQADSLEEAQALLSGYPVYEAGGVVEIRALPESQT